MSSRVAHPAEKPRSCSRRVKPAKDRCVDGRDDASPGQGVSGMDIFGAGLGTGPMDGHRERIYGGLATLLSHPDEGKWGRVLNANEQRLLIQTADAVRAMVSVEPYTLLPPELGCEELDLRFLVLDLCQPLEHLKAEYERVLCVKRPRKGCSPFALDHLKSKPKAGHDQAEHLADLASLYRAFDFAEGSTLPRRPDHVACE